MSKSVLYACSPVTISKMTFCRATSLGPSCAINSGEAVDAQASAGGASSDVCASDMDDGFRLRPS